MLPSGLPIDAALPALRAALAERGGAVLQAPPGAGKSTVVPLALIDEDWARGRRIVMLEPRRLATRAVAQRMAGTLGESVGATVGYRMRMDTRVSRATRIEVVTDGVLTRMLRADPALAGVALVIFDEFHERSLQGDLGLALTLDARAALAPELRVLAMSATLAPEPVAALLGDAPTVTTAGNTFSVTVEFTGTGPPRLAGGTARDSPEASVARVVTQALARHAGDALVFLPGGREIRRVRALLEESGLPDTMQVLPLFGDLDAAAQDAALAPAPPGRRKIVLATNIAETSLTIDGVRIVVDSGLVRRAVFDPASGMSRLETQRVSQAEAEQRRGRAGRTAPGVCYRLWSAAAHAGLAAYALPEIASADLAPLALDLAEWGVADPRSLRWLDVPPSAQLASARDLLGRLGALGSDGRITAHGRAMADVGVHPRLAHMLLRSLDLDCLDLAAEIAALVSDRDLLRAGTKEAHDADIHTRLAVLRREAGHGGRVDRNAVARARRLAVELTRRLRTAATPERTGDVRPRGPALAAGADLSGVLLAFAYPDRVGRRRGGSTGRYALANGRGAAFAEPQALAREEYLVAVDLDDRDREARILLAARLDRAAIETHLGDRLETRESIAWSTRDAAVVARRAVMLDALVVDEQPLAHVPAELAVAAMLDGIRELSIDALPWTPAARELQARIEFARALGAPETAAWPAVDDGALGATLTAWLGPWLTGITRREHLARVPLRDALRARLPWDAEQRLDALAPSHLEVPSGSRIAIDYRDANAPLVSVRLQEIFGLRATPRIGGGRVPVTFALLSPARRPVQVTRDLDSFWRTTYADVRKELKPRYPKHYWPEDPFTAVATARVRPRPG